MMGDVTSAALIVNPISGHIRYPRQVEAVQEIFSSAGVNLEIKPTRYPGHARDLAREASEIGIPLIISMGGDGTLNEVINGMLPGQSRLALIPAGISNVLALELGIPFDVRQAAQLALWGKKRRLDLGSVNGRYFSLMVSVGGIDAYACKVVNKRLKKRLKRYAFHLAGFQALTGYQPGPFRLLVDAHEKIEGYAAVISNSRYYGGTHQITPEAKIDDGWLDLCVYLEGRRRDYIRYFRKVLAGSIQNDDGVIIRRCRKVKIEKSQLPMQADGDYIGESPATLEIAPRILEVMAPEKVLTPDQIGNCDKSMNISAPKTVNINKEKR